MIYFNTKLSAVKGVLYDLEKSIAAIPEGEATQERLNNQVQAAIGYINKLSELEKMDVQQRRKTRVVFKK
jgi:hypothetical protein